MNLFAKKLYVLKNEKIGAIILAGVLAIMLTVGGISAYFTDGDSVTNAFTVGKISLELKEPDWDPENAKDIVPGQTITKNPQVINDGANAEYVFVEVIVPYETLQTVNADGTRNPAQDTELYSYLVNQEWHMMERTVNVEEKTVTYLYAYGTADQCTELPVGETTPAVFEAVTFANIVENEALEGTTLEITLNAYGIQTTNLNGGVGTPVEVWAVITNQLISAG